MTEVDHDVIAWQFEVLHRLAVAERYVDLDSFVVLICNLLSVPEMILHDIKSLVGDFSQQLQCKRLC